MHPFLQRYQTVSVPALKKEHTYESEYLIPKVSKIVVNVGLGDVLTNGGAVEQVVSLLEKITGQKPVLTKAAKAISGFKIRQGMVVGAKVTLRGERMNDFASKLITITLPRTRDFRGIPVTSITPDGNLHIGIKDSMIFPEVAQENFSHPLQVTLVAKTRSRDEALCLYESLGFVFQSQSK